MHRDSAIRLREYGFVRVDPLRAIAAATPVAPAKLRDAQLYKVGPFSAGRAAARGARPPNR